MLQSQSWYAYVPLSLKGLNSAEGYTDRAETHLQTRGVSHKSELNQSIAFEECMNEKKLLKITKNVIHLINSKSSKHSIKTKINM